MLCLKVRTLIIVTIMVFICLGKWANDGLKMEVVMFHPLDLRCDVGFFVATNSLVIFKVDLLFVAMKTFVVMSCSFVMANQRPTLFFHSTSSLQ